MSLLKRIFSNKDHPEPLHVRFGRYTDSYKTDRQFDAWDQAVQLFEEGEYLPAYKTFFEYLKDEEEDNVHVEQKEGALFFEIFQGSRVITGMATPKKVRAIAKVAQPDALDTRLMKRLLEQNFDMEYSRFCLDDEQHIAVTFDTYTLDGSPYKLYYALKELATCADKQDDLLLDEFGAFQPVASSPVEHLPMMEKKAKYQFIHQSIAEVIHQVENGPLDVEQYAGGIAYLLLDLVYKLDYLVRPEGFMMEALERIHRLYFTQNDEATVQKNRELVAELKSLLQRPQSAYYKEMYKVVSTFGITTAVNYSRIVDFIEGELPNWQWYHDNGYRRVACAIPGYIVGYCLFNYAVPKPCKDFFQLYYQITEADFFAALGFERFYQPRQQKFYKKAIKKAILRIVAHHVPAFERLKADHRQLRFDSTAAFSLSYLQMMEKMDMTKTG